MCLLWMTNSILYISQCDAILIAFCEQRSLIVKIEYAKTTCKCTNTFRTLRSARAYVSIQNKPIRTMEKAKGVTPILTKMCAIRNGSSHFLRAHAKSTSHSMRLSAFLFKRQFCHSKPNAFQTNVFEYTTDRLFIAQISISLLCFQRKQKHQ